MANPSNHPQLPGAGEVYLDHVGWFVHDMDYCSAKLTSLGFPLTPYSVHGNRDPETGKLQPTGTANRLVMLEGGYLEFLVAIDGVESPVSQHLRDCLARHEGVHLAAFAVADAEAERGRLEATGFSVLPTVHLRRQIERADGSPGEVAFTLARPELGSFPEGRIQMLTHHTPDDMWQDRYVSAANGISALESVLFVSEYPGGSADRLAKFTNRPATPLGHIDGFQIRLDRGRLQFMTHGDAASHLGGAEIVPEMTVAAIGFRGDPARALQSARDAGIAASQLGDGRTLIPAEAALGCYLTVG